MSRSTIELANPAGGAVTASDVARRAGVSTMTVSLVVNGSPRISPATSQRVQAVIAETGYVPNRLARTLAGHRLNVVAVVLGDITQPWHAAATKVVEAVASQRGQTVIVCNHGDEPARERAHLEKLRELHVDGVLMVPCGDASAPAIEVLERAGVPVVLVERAVRGCRADIVRVDSVRGAEVLTEHLLAHGHRRVTGIFGPRSMSTSRDRARGFQRALRCEGLDRAGDEVMFSRHSIEAGYAAAIGTLRSGNPPSAFLAGNGELARGIARAIREVGASPADVALATFDDVEFDSFEPHLTCYALPVTELGRTALEILEERLAGDLGARREVLLEGDLRLRASCGCPPVHDPQAG